MRGLSIFISLCEATTSTPSLKINCKYEGKLSRSSRTGEAGVVGRSFCARFTPPQSLGSMTASDIFRNERILSWK